MLFNVSDCVEKFKDVLALLTASCLSPRPLSASPLVWQVPMMTGFLEKTKKSSFAVDGKKSERHGHRSFSVF
ncbi:MAG: hypothetical protein WC378_11145 [Opitutaceae bacterium]|jgi:hypothetical protein